jgi:hypothetical protein
VLGRRREKEHGYLWRSFFDPFYIPRPLFLYFIDALIVGGVFATIGGILLGWEGVAIGVIFGLLLAAMLWARLLLVRWVIRKRRQGK